MQQSHFSKQIMVGRSTMDTNKSDAAGIIFRSIISIDNNRYLDCQLLSTTVLYHYLQALLPKTGVLDAMYDKLFSIYETKNEPLRMSERYFDMKINKEKLCRDNLTSVF